MFTWHKFLPDQFVGLLLFFFLISLGLHNLLACTLFPFFPPLALFMDLLAYWALLLPLDSHSPFTLLLPLMCLWACWLSFPAMLTHWAFTSFLGPSWSLLLPLVVPMGLLAVTSYHVGPLGFYLFPWVLMAHLPCFYLLLHPWACWLVGLLLLSLDSHDLFSFILFLNLFLLHFLLMLGFSAVGPFLSKMGINRDQSK